VSPRFEGGQRDDEFGAALGLQAFEPAAEPSQRSIVEVEPVLVERRRVDSVPARQSNLHPARCRGCADVKARHARSGHPFQQRGHDVVESLCSDVRGPASAELNQIAQGRHGKLVLNVRDVEYVSSAGLRAMLVAAKLVQTHGGTLTVCDANATVTEVMEISGMARLLRLCSTEEEAIAAFT